MLNQKLRELSKLGYILIVEDGECKITERETGEVELTFSSQEKSDTKEWLVQKFCFKKKDELAELAKEN